MEAILDRSVHAMAKPGRWWRYLLAFSLLQMVILIMQTWPRDTESWLLIMIVLPVAWLNVHPLNQLFDLAARFMGGEIQVPMLRAVSVVFMPIGIIAQSAVWGMALLSIPAWVASMIDYLMGFFILVLYIRAVCRLYAFSLGRYLMTEIIRIYLIAGTVMIVIIPVILLSDWMGWLS